MLLLFNEEREGNSNCLATFFCMRLSVVVLHAFYSLRAQTVLRGVVAPCYQHLDNEVPQLHVTLSEPLDYTFYSFKAQTSAVRSCGTSLSNTPCGGV